LETQEKVHMIAAIGLGWGEAIVVLVVVLILFGAKRLPELARSLGSSVKELQKGLEDGLAEDEEPDDKKD
jgi:sec-independent protein translocase protein TatA